MITWSELCRRLQIVPEDPSGSPRISLLLDGVPIGHVSVVLLSEHGLSESMKIVGRELSRVLQAAEPIITTTYCECGQVFDSPGEWQFHATLTDHQHYSLTKS